MKKQFIALLSAASLLFTACSNGSPSSDTVSEGSSSAVTIDSEVTVDISQEDIELTNQDYYNRMIERSLLSMGDTARMENVLRKAERGEEITVAYIGGSITYGMTVAPASPEKCWAYLTYKWLCDKYPQAKVNYVNAGISGTPSILGNLRLERDVLSFEPDICFVEFAVNDGNGFNYKSAYESLVRTLFADENDIAVVLFFTILKSGHTCQPHMSQIGENYSLPMISEPDSLWVEMNEGRMSWEDYSDDESHPNEYGHQVVADLITYYFENVINGMSENDGVIDKTLPAPVFSERYQNMHYIDNETLEVTEAFGFVEDAVHENFKNGWSYKGDTGASLKFTIRCKSLEMVYKENNSKVYGDADIYIDGEKYTTIRSNVSDGWNNPETAFLIDRDEVAEHEVEIVVEQGKKCYFGIMGFGYCD